MDISLAKQLYSGKGPENIKNSGKPENREGEKDEKALKEACRGFEAIFIESMIKSMRSTLPGDALFKKSHGMDIYKSMHDRYLAENISQGENATGIGEYLYRQLQDSL